MQAFEPYLRDVYAYLKSLLTLEGEENTSLRAYATDTLGSIIKNMGRSYFEADLQEIMTYASPPAHLCFMPLCVACCLSLCLMFGRATLQRGHGELKYG